MTKTINMVATLELQTCITCGIIFAAPDSFLDTLRANHKTFYCPNGHGQCFAGTSDLEKAQAEIAKLKKLYQEEQRYAADAISERNAAQKSLKATKSELTRTKKRIANGVCPVCKRVFSPLSEHMHMEHPEYVTEGDETPSPIPYPLSPE